MSEPVKATKKGAPRKAPAKAAKKAPAKNKAGVRRSLEPKVFRRAPEDVTNKVSSWVNSQGYPLELRVAREIRQLGGTARNSVYFADPIEDKDREIDVVGDFYQSTHSQTHDESPTEFDVWVSVVLAIECKYSDQPWVAFVDPPNSGYMSKPRRTYRMTPDLDELLKTGRRRFLDMFSFQRARGAFGIAQSKLPTNNKGNQNSQKRESGVDVAYAALRKASTASKALALGDDVIFADDDFSIMIPVVVVDGFLYECHLDPDTASIVIEDAAHVTVDLKHSGSPVHVVTFDYLPKFLEQIHRFSGHLLEEVVSRLQAKEERERKDAPDASELGP